MKWRQLSLFSDRHVERSALCRTYLNPPADLIHRLRFENRYGMEHPLRARLGLYGTLDHWNVMRHRTGGRTMKIVKIGKKYFYEPINAHQV